MVDRSAADATSHHSSSHSSHSHDHGIVAERRRLLAELAQAETRSLAKVAPEQIRNRSDATVAATSLLVGKTEADPAAAAEAATKAGIFRKIDRQHVLRSIEQAASGRASERASGRVETIAADRSAPKLPATAKKSTVKRVIREIETTTASGRSSLRHVDEEAKRVRDAPLIESTTVVRRTDARAELSAALASTSTQSLRHVDASAVRDNSTPALPREDESFSLRRRNFNDFRTELRQTALYEDLIAVPASEIRDRSAPRIDQRVRARVAVVSQTHEAVASGGFNLRHVGATERRDRSAPDVSTYKERIQFDGARQFLAAEIEAGVELKPAAVLADRSSARLPTAAELSVSSQGRVTRSALLDSIVSESHKRGAAGMRWTQCVTIVRHFRVKDEVTLMARLRDASAEARDESGVTGLQYFVEDGTALELFESPHHALRHLARLDRQGVNECWILSGAHVFGALDATLRSSLESLSSGQVKWSAWRTDAPIGFRK